MKKYLPILIFILVSSCSNQSNDDIGQILIREGVIYSEKTNEPINGTYTYKTIQGDNYSTSFKNGIRHGVQKLYDSDGYLIIRENYKDGVLHGLHESFNSNGVLIFSGNYENGKEIGVWKFFDDSGELLATGNSKWDARDNHYKNTENIRLEEIKRRDIPDEVD